MSEGTRIETDGRGNWPPMLIMLDRVARPEVIENIRRGFKDAEALSKPLILEPGFTVFQLIDGRWVQLGAPRLLPEPPADSVPYPPEGSIADQFIKEDLAKVLEPKSDVKFRGWT